MTDRNDSREAYHHSGPTRASSADDDSQQVVRTDNTGAGRPQSSTVLAQFSLNNVHKRGHHFIFLNRPSKLVAPKCRARTHNTLRR